MERTDREARPAARVEAPLPAPRARNGVTVFVLRVAWLLVLLFLFLVAIETMGKAIRAVAEAGILGGAGEGELFAGVSNPLAALAVGVLFTVLVQSSSTTTATIVAVVGSGSLSVENAVPMILGANIGTTITNTLVSIGHVRRSDEFRRAFAAATVHDFFNIMGVAVVLPIELATGFLSRSARAVTDSIGGMSGAVYDSPIEAGIKGAHGLLESAVEGLGLAGATAGIVLLVVGIVITYACLQQITRNMRRLMAGRIESGINRALEASSVVGVGVGAGITVAVQSSSITTSLLVPLCAAGIMSLASAFPVMLGANIGTTVTGVLASLAAERMEALTIALVHVFFNVIAVTVCLSVPGLRQVPIALANGLAERTTRSPLWVVAYVLGLFVVVPGVAWLLWG